MNRLSVLARTGVITEKIAPAASKNLVHRASHWASVVDKTDAATSMHQADVDI